MQKYVWSISQNTGSRSRVQSNRLESTHRPVVRGCPVGGRNENGDKCGTTWFREPPTNITLSERGNSFKFHCLHQLALATVSLLGLHCAKLFHAYSYQQYSASLNNWGYMLIDSGLLFWGESCRQTDDSSYLDWHGFCGAVEACSQSFLHCINALISVARHLNICNSQSRAGEGRVSLLEQLEGAHL